MKTIDELAEETFMELVIKDNEYPATHPAFGKGYRGTAKHKWIEAFKLGYEANNTTVQNCIDTVKSLVRDNCSDHTPYWGPCGTCGNRNNYEVLPSPEDVIEALEELK